MIRSDRTRRRSDQNSIASTCRLAGDTQGVTLPGKLTASHASETVLWFQHNTKDQGSMHNA
jgi:hypothetical protein